MFSLGFFALEGNPSLCMRVLYLRLWDRCVLCVSEKQRGETVRENRGYYSDFAIGCVSSFCWIIERKDWLFGVDVAKTGWTTYICVSLVLCVFCVYISAIFYVFHCSIIYNFLTKILLLSKKLKSRKKIRKVTRWITIGFHTIQVKKIKVQKVCQPHILGFMQEVRELQIWSMELEFEG